jgi:hydroxymethylbilane synthase
VNRTLRIGTRGSDLALWQAHHVATLLSRLGGADGNLQIQIVEIRTEGDHVLDRPLSEVPGKAFFTKEIEEALAAGHVDLAVHSLKDLPTELPDGLALAAVLEREDPRDVWLAKGGSAGAGFAALPAGGRVGTSSLRRRALLARYRPDLELVDLRGNVPTRVRRVEEGKYDAIILAAAGVKRLGLERHITQYLPLDRFLPAVAQGAVAVEIRAHDEATRDWVRRLDHPPTHLTTAAERALLAALQGGCQVPVGALATLAGEQLTLAAEVVALDGGRFVSGRKSGPATRPEELGRALAEELVAGGAAEILAQIRRAGGGLP